MNVEVGSYQNGERFCDERRGGIFLLCLFYAIHMVEEFSCGFVPWADRYFGSFDWTQNLIGNAMFFVCLAAACYLCYRNPAKYLWVGMAGVMWILANAFLHISSTILGREYSPGVVTATIIYVPGWVVLSWEVGQEGIADLEEHGAVIHRRGDGVYARSYVRKSNTLPRSVGKDLPLDGMSYWRSPRAGRSGT
jgi:hypothetical protein